MGKISMDPKTNPFAPGAGSPPPELAGRDEIMAEARVVLSRAKSGLHARGQMLLGLRGVGKTVLLNRIAEFAVAEGYEPIELEAPEDRRLADMLVPELRALLVRLSRQERAKNLARQALGVLRAFAGAFKVKAGDIEFSGAKETGTADSGNIESDLPDLMLTVARTAKEAGTAVALLIDEVQYLSEADLSALIVSVHKMTQKALPFILFGAGLPQLAALAGEAKSYAERLFDYPGVGPLLPDAAKSAIREPVRRAGARIEEAALDVIVRKTQGYPYFLQEWGKYAWNTTVKSPIKADDAQRATTEALAHLDSSFFKVRFDRLTPREKEYLRAMAEMGPGPHRSGEIARVLSITVTTAAPLRNGLIRKGMIYSPQHGDTAFTVPMFDEFMRRSMPDWIKPAKVKARPRRKTE